MIVWILIFGLLFIFSILEVCGQKNILVVRNVSFNSIVFFYLAFFLFLITSLRFEIGYDWVNYLYMYHHYNPNTSFIESGYIRMNVFFRNLNLGDKGFYLMQFVIMSFCCGVIHKNIYKENEYPIFILSLYFTLYFFPIEIDQTRQFIAMSILICGNKFIVEEKIILWILIVVLAMQFHITAIIAFPLYFTERVHFSPPIAFVLLLLALVLNLAGLNIIWAMLHLIMKINLLPDRFSNIVNNYMNSSIYGKQAQFSSGLGLLVSYLFYFIFVFLWSIKSKKTRKKYNLTNFLIGVFFTSMARNFDQFSRIAYYYFICGNGISVYNSLPSSIKFFKKTDVVRIVLVVFYSLFILYNFLIGGFMDNYRYIYHTFLLHQF